ncbi:MAG: hypothetical protein LQ340_004570, partial [Diploschistes diacapsis]
MLRVEQFSPPRVQPRIKELLNSVNRYAQPLIQVDTSVEMQLLVLTLSTGIQDAESLPNFRCFASNQTGNTVILALGLAGYSSDLFDIHNVAISLAMFVLGATVTGQLGNWVGGRRKAWQVLANFWQTAMVVGAACLQFTGNAHQPGPCVMGAIALLAFASGAQ